MMEQKLHCNSIAQVRKVGEPFKEDISQSLASTVTLLNDVICRLELKGKKFKVYDSCSVEDIQEF